MNVRTCVVIGHINMSNALISLAVSTCTVVYFI